MEAEPVAEEEAEPVAEETTEEPIAMQGNTNPEPT
uniref:Uncharacterized protein n=1 Tax=Arundo donax TaxID=35708 RepID=A0A0A8ZXH9_ARUDO